jgi:hypothetical protein
LDHMSYLNKLPLDICAEISKLKFSRLHNDEPGSDK